MPDQKIDNLLNLAMDATSEERAKSENLNVGYDSSERLWDVIVKYSGPESRLGGEGIQVVPLLGGYAVVTLPESEIKAYSAREQIEFIEKPKRLYFETFQGREASCIMPVQEGKNGLTGKGVLVGIVDAGVNFFIRIFEMRMEAAGYYICGIRAYPEILRKATQKERNIRKKKLIRRLHLGKPKAGALFHPEMSVDMERQCSELRREMGRYRRV